MNALEASSVSRRYGEQEVLREFSLSLAEGEFVALMGPSGSGKSTFLHIASGLIKADSGTVLVGGVDVTAMGDTAATRFRRRHVGVVFQAFNLLETANVEANIVLPAKLDHAKVDKSRLDELVDKLGLSGMENRFPSELSGGERQRVAMARALFAKPEVVLADEPTGNLDTKASNAICRLLGEINRTEKSAILVVTHDPVVAASATRVAFLKDGRIAASHPTGNDPELVSRLYLETCA